MPRTLLVTDSTASLTAEVAATRGIVVVPLQVVIGADQFDEGSAEATPAKVADALKEFVPVTTSRPNPTVMGEVYARAAADGYDAVVSVHLSGQMSGTFDSAQVAAADAPLPVHCVDSATVGPAIGFAVLAAQDLADTGAEAEQVAALARARCAASTSLFYVDTLEYLRRGGRIGAAAAFVGGALAVKPLLTVREGKVESLEKVRTSTRALGRLEELAVQAAGDQPVQVAVCHLASPTRAETLGEHLTERLSEQLAERTVDFFELGPVIGAHVGPGVVAVCVAPLGAD